MAITILNQPGLFAPAQSPMYFRVNSTNTSQCGFHYIFDIFTGNTDYKSRQRLQARPDGTCVFTPNTVLKSYLGYDLQPRISACTQARNSAMQYRITFGEEYGLSNNCVTGTTVFSGLTTQSGYCWNSVIQYDQFPTFKYTQFYMTGSTGRFLTNRPDSLVVNNDEWETISFLNIDSGGTKVAGFVYEFNLEAGGLSQTHYLSNPYSANTLGAAKLINVPVGINNLTVAFGVPFITSQWDYYTITAASGATPANSLTGISEFRKFRFANGTNSRCSKYPTIRIAFLNTLGAFEFYNFDTISRKTLTVTRDMYQKPLPFNYQVGDRGRAVVEMTASERVTIGTDFLTTAVSEWLCNEFYITPEAYEMKSDGTILPITIEPGSIEVKNTINDKLVELAFAFTYAFDRSTTSGGGGSVV